CHGLLVLRDRRAVLRPALGSRLLLRFPLSCPPPLRDLHSFPTRRSSDLHEFGDGAAQGHHPEADGACDLCRSPPHRRADVGERQDRKSTRLNSSHDQISYAVFCLKKKKTNHHQAVATVAAPHPRCTLASL